jgi:hypothetical protein
MNMRKGLALRRQKSPTEELSHTQRMLLKMQHNNYVFTEKESQKFKRIQVRQSIDNACASSVGSVAM